jgi:hypothetical protein
MLRHVPKKIGDRCSAKERAHKEHVRSLLAKTTPSLSDGPWATLV